MRFFLVKRLPALTPTDCYGHLIQEKELRENGLRPPSEMRYSLLRMPYDNPPLFHYFLALSPEGRKVRWGRAAIIACDAVHSLLVFAATLALTQNPVAAAFAGLLFALTPASASESMFFTARPLGALFFSACFLSFFASSFTGQNVWFAAAIASAALVLLSHKMATQALLFASAAMAVLLEDVFFLVPFAAAFFLVVVLSGGWFLRVVVNHVTILDFWRKNISRRRSSFDFVRFVTHSLSGFLFNPWLLFVFLAWFGGNFAGYSAFLLYWALAAAFLAFVTAFPPLAFLGENRRYLEYGALPSLAITAAYVFSNATAFTAVLFAACLACCALVFKKILDKIYADYAAVFKGEKTLREALEFVRKRREARVLCVPDLNSVVAYECGKKTTTNSSTLPWRDNPWLVFQDDLVRDLPRIMKKLGVELLVLDGNAKKKVEIEKRWKKIFENKGYAVYKTTKFS